MEKSREALLIVSDACYPDAVGRGIRGGGHSDEPVRAGVEAVVAMAELDPQGARAALWRLQTDWTTLKRLERASAASRPRRRCGSARRSSSPGPSSASPAPQLRRRLPGTHGMAGSTRAERGGVTPCSRRRSRACCRGS